MKAAHCRLNAEAPEPMDVDMTRKRKPGEKTSLSLPGPVTVSSERTKHSRDRPVSTELPDSTNHPWLVWDES